MSHLFFKEACTTLSKSTPVRSLSATSARKLGAIRRTQQNRQHNSQIQDQNEGSTKPTEQPARKPNDIAQKTRDFANQTVQKGRMLSAEMMQQSREEEMVRIRTECGSGADALSERLPRYTTVWPHLW